MRIFIQKCDKNHEIFAELAQMKRFIDIKILLHEELYVQERKRLRLGTVFRDHSLADNSLVEIYNGLVSTHTLPSVQVKFAYKFISP